MARLCDPAVRSRLRSWFAAPKIPLEIVKISFVNNPKFQLTEQRREMDLLEKIEAMDNLIAWLPQHIPADDDTRIVHGDYRLDNVIFHPTEPRILAVLDWELSTLGHPLADFAYHCMTWRFPSGVQSRGLLGADFAALGIASESEYIAMYCRRLRLPKQTSTRFFPRTRADLECSGRQVGPGRK